MKTNFAMLIIILTIGICLEASAGDQNRVLPFTPGEVLKYELKWQFIPVGIAELRVLPMTIIAGKEAYHFVVTATSNELVDVFYKVRDRIEAFADKEMTRSLLYKKKTREGKRRREVTVSFDWANLEAQYTNFGKSRKPIPIRPGTFDPLSVFYAFRFHPLEANSQLEAPVTDGKKCVIGRASIRDKQKVIIGDQTYNTILVEPDLKEVRGVFEKSKNARLRIWITDDKRHIPVKIETRVIVGHFQGELISIEQESGGELALESRR